MKVADIFYSTKNGDNDAKAHTFGTFGVGIKGVIMYSQLTADGYIRLITSSSASNDISKGT